MYEDLNNKEVEILYFIKSTIESKGYPPTVREICDGVDLKSPSSVHGYLERLESKDYIIRTASKTRSIVLKEMEDDYLANSKSTIDVPIVGRVAAGQPILAAENIEDTFPISANIAKDKELFMLKVVGDSMINVGIFSGDYVLIERRSYAKNGDIVLALLEDSATIKTFYKETNHFRLQPENDSMNPILTDELEILGHVIGLYRSLV